MSSRQPTDEDAGEGHAPLAGEPPPDAGGAPPAAPRVVVPRWIQLVALPLGVIALYLIAKAAGVVLLAFTVAAVIALILNPMVSFLQRRRVPRGVGLLGGFLGVVAAGVGAGGLLGHPGARQGAEVGGGG